VIDTLRNSLRDLGATLLNSEMVYSFLMGMGWFFLLGWAVALLVACASVFRQDGMGQLVGAFDKGPPGNLALKIKGPRR